MRVFRYQVVDVFAAATRTATGLSVGIVGSSCALVWLTLIGTHLASSVMLTAALTCGAAAGLLIARRSSSAVTRTAFVVLAATFCILLPAVLDGLLTMGVQAVYPQTLLGSVTALLPCTGIAALTMMLTVASAVRGFPVEWVPENHNSRSSSQRSGMRASLWTGFGFAAGILIPLVNVWQSVSLGWLAAVGLLPLFAAAVYSLRQSSDKRDANPESENASGLAWRADLATVGVALALPAVWHDTIYLMPAALWMLPVAAAGVALITIVLAQLFGRAIPRRGTPLRVLFIVGCAALGSLPLLFDSLLALNLNWSAQASDPLWLTTLRAVELILLLSPIALCLAVIWWTQSPQNGESHFQNLVISWGGGVACGMLALGIGVSSVWLLATAVIVALTGHQLRSDSAVARPPISMRTVPRFVLPVGVAGLALTGAIVCSPQSSFQRAERLLFSTQGLQGLRAGESPDLILQSQDVRCVHRAETHDGPVSVWRRAASQLQFRRHGLPVASAGTNSAMTPLPGFDVLSVVLPVAFHRSPRELLILGDDGGMALRTASGLPIPAIRAVRRDAGVTRFVEDTVWAGLSVCPTQDGRITLEYGTPAWRIRSLEHDSCDIAIVASPPATVPGAATEFNVEFYRQLRSVVRDDGLVCQQVHQEDVGAESLTRMMATMQTHFAEVSVVQAAPGKILLLGSDSQEGIVRRGFLKRLSRDHVCELLAESGLDWVEAAMLPIVDGTDPVGIFADDSVPAGSTIASADFALQLPLDAIRPVDKATELAEVFAPHQQLLVSLSTSKVMNAEVVRRMSALTQQKEILSEFPDLPWTYRRSLRSEMERNPRPPREDVENGEIVKTIDPREQIRVDYFRTLAEVSGMPSPSPHEIDRVAAFSLTHEPLVNHFARHEALRLMEKVDDPRSDLVFQHRLKATYFTVGKDRSVRHAAAAIEQLLDDPDLVGSPAERFDVVNSLLQVLHQRWQMRRDFPPASARIVENDIRLTLAAVENALDRLPEWAEQSGVDPDTMIDRRKFLNKSLIAPLYQYREQVIAHRARGAIARTANGPAETEEFDPDADPIFLPSESLQTN